MVEARGVEPLSEDRQRTGPTCVADSLFLQPPTPIGRLRTAASPESSRPQPLSTSLGPACCIAPLPPPQASDGETSRTITPRVPVRCWQLLVSRRFYESPRARHAPVTSVSPSKPVAPLSSRRESFDVIGERLKSPKGFVLPSHLSDFTPS